MRASFSTLENNRVKLSVEVDETEMAAAMDKAAASLAQRVSIKGFRKGKVPKNVLIANIGGPSALRGEAIRESLDEFYARAVNETAIDPIAQPEVTITGGETEGTLTFEADVDVRPELDLVGYRELRVTIPSPVVNDDEVEAQINRFRETDATLNDVDRPIVLGDLVSMDISATQSDSDADPFEMNDFMYTVGSGSITPEVDTLILGLRAGEDLQVQTDGANGATVTYSLHLKQVKEKILPELTDEWVEENTDWPTVAEMRGAVLEQMSSMRRREVTSSRNESALVALAELVDPEIVPTSLIEAESNDRLHQLGHRLSEQRIGFEQYLSATGQTPESLLAQIRYDSTVAVRIDLALRAIARIEGLEANAEDIEKELAVTAESLSTPVEELRRSLAESSRDSAFAKEVAKVKAQRWLLENVVYVDPLGTVIDRAQLDALGEDDSDESDADEQ
ncbi:MAG: trigger factor [Acidobacteria bacterium]|nr:trigger factor [Acidobacteriota bacterium]